MDDIVEPGDDVDVLDAAYEVILLAKNGLNFKTMRNRNEIKKIIRFNQEISKIKEQKIKNIKNSLLRFATYL